MLKRLIYNSGNNFLIWLGVGGGFLILTFFLIGGVIIFNYFGVEISNLPKVNLAQIEATPKAELPPFTTTTPTAEKLVEETTHAFGILQIIVRLIVAVILSAILAFRPRKNVRLFERNLYVAQTQILLSVVAAALMMIVGDNTARAFAIFAAVSLVRFRTNIRDPKEVTILLICLAIGLSAGVGRWDLGLILCFFVLVLLWGLELKEPDQAVRPMELTIKTRNIDSTNRALQTIFERFQLETEVRQLTAPDEKNPIGNIVHYLNLRLSLSTDYLSSQIVALDKDNIEGIQWQQKKSATDIYQ